MTAEFNHFLKLRDDLFVAMTEAAAKRVASESLKAHQYFQQLQVQVEVVVLLQLVVVLQDNQEDQVVVQEVLELLQLAEQDHLDQQLKMVYQEVLEEVEELVD